MLGFTRGFVANLQRAFPDDKNMAESEGVDWYNGSIGQARKDQDLRTEIVWPATFRWPPKKLRTWFRMPTRSDRRSMAQLFSDFSLSQIPENLVRLPQRIESRLEHAQTEVSNQKILPSRLVSSKPSRSSSIGRVTAYIQHVFRCLGEESSSDMV